jgi:hypothetical protein
MKRKKQIKVEDGIKWVRYSNDEFWVSEEKS